MTASVFAETITPWDHEEQLREGHLISIAHDLNVTLKVVADWLKWRESNAGDFRPRELMT
jgi:hypothetical protein